MCLTGPSYCVNDMLMGQLFRYREPSNRPPNPSCCDICSQVVFSGKTFSCKFSRNKNNLNIFGCSVAFGDILIGNAAIKPYSYVRSKYK